jgi:hypothetical protein
MRAMFLVGPGDKRVALCYSMNVHPGEGLDDVLAALEGTVAPLKERLGAAGGFAVGLRLAGRAAKEIETRASELKETLDGHGLRAVTVNAFPFGDFHGERVKEEVYRPDWTSSERAVYSLRAAVALAAVNERGAELCISTVPLSYKAFNPAVNAVTGRLLDACWRRRRKRSPTGATTSCRRVARSSAAAPRISRTRFSASVSTPATTPSAGRRARSRSTSTARPGSRSARSS